MTEIEATEWIQELKGSEEIQEFYYAESFIKACDIAMQALEEVQKYREIGSIEECRASREKQIAKKPNKTIDSSWGIKKEVHVCPACDYYLTEVHFIAPQKIESNKKITYCETCGQAIDWSDEDEID